MKVAAGMILQLALLKLHYGEDTIYDVVDTRIDWLATNSFNDLPCITMITDSNNKENLPIMALHSNELYKH